MSSKRILVVMIAVLVALTAAISFAADQPVKAKKSVAPAEKKAEPAAKDAAPRLTIVEPIKDYGTISKGEKLDWSFLVKNTGDADLVITSAKPGCGCTVADFDKVIKPGETGKVTAHVDTTAFVGPIAKTVTLETNDLTTPTSQLTIHAIVKPYVEAFPAGFVRFNLLHGETESQNVILYSEEEEPFAVTKVELPIDPTTNEPVKWVNATYEKIATETDKAPNVGRPGQDQYKVKITVGGPDTKLGPLSDHVRIITTSKHQPEYVVSISGVVRPSFRIEPTALNFGEVSPVDVAATRTVILHSNNLRAPESFVVSKVESSVPTVVSSVKPTANKGEYEVTLQIAKDAKPGDVDGTVKIYTNDKMNPIVTVPMKATIKAGAPAKSAAK
ncbi:MAG TPA: DUF1573 domain-containing protein [Thermoanaerobaculia bacterium]|jgi:hypothetical protein|nr:DUF1573 domain-containing protein [Thermoanaerobaculia bacterium]